MFVPILFLMTKPLDNDETTKEKIEREVKQIGIDVFIFGLIIALIVGASIGVFFAP